MTSEPKIQLSDSLVAFMLSFEFTKIEGDTRNYFYEPIEIIGKGQLITTKIRYSKTIGPLTHLYTEVGAILDAFDHPKDDDIIKGLFAVFGIASSASRSLQLIYEFFSLIRSLRVKQYFFFHPTASEKIPNLSFGDFIIGSIDFRRFATFVSNHSGSDFADNEKQPLTNKYGIEVKNHQVSVLDFYQWLELLRMPLANLPKIHQELINYYLTPLSVTHYQNFKRKFYQQIQFTTAFFGVSYSLEELEKYGFTFVNVYYQFLRNPRVGWVLPITGDNYEVSLPDARLITRINRYLGKQDAEKLNKVGEYSTLLNTLSYFFSNAQRQIDLNAFSEAFIGFFVGLDFFLAPNREASKKLKQRISILTFRYFKHDYILQLQELDKLYEVRNAFVHAGVVVHEPDLVKLRNIARIILSVCRQLHLNNAVRVKVSYPNWIKLLDEHIQNQSKGMKPTVKQLKDIGIHDFSNVPIQTELRSHNF